MTNRLFTGMVKSLKPLFVNGFTKELMWSFIDRDKYLEHTLDEICMNCSLHNTSPGDNGSEDDLIVIDECRMKYFGKLLQSFVGRPGDDETIKLFSYLKKCEDCLASKTQNTFELKGSDSVINNLITGKGKRNN
jgi:hypothetical protein